MYNNYSMDRRHMNYPTNQQRGFIPFLVGGALGYGIGVNSNRPNFYPVPVQPIFFPPRPIWVGPPMMMPSYRNNRRY